MKCHFYLVVAFVLASQPSSGAQPGQVLITELMAGNDATLCDKSNRDPDWVEIYNDSDTEVDLSGWFLSDEEENPQRWPFPPNTRLKGKHYLLILVSGRDRVGDGEIHTNFRLDFDDGEQILLVNPDGEVVDRLNFGVQERDRSFGRSADLEDIGPLERPTPGVWNGSDPRESNCSLPRP